MDTIFMNSENRKTSYPHNHLNIIINIFWIYEYSIPFIFVLIYLKQTWEEMKKVLHYQIIVSTLHRKIWKAHIKTINPMINSGLFWDIQDYFEYIITKHKTLTNNLQIKICINKIKNRITFKFKTEHQLELLKPELTKLLENTKRR